MIKCLLPSGSLDFSQELEELRAAADGNMRIMTDTLTLQERGRSGVGAGAVRSGGEAKAIQGACTQNAQTEARSS